MAGSGIALYFVKKNIAWFVVADFEDGERIENYFSPPKRSYPGTPERLQVTHPLIHWYVCCFYVHCSKKPYTALSTSPLESRRQPGFVKGCMRRAQALAGRAIHREDESYTCDVHVQGKNHVSAKWQLMLITWSEPSVSKSCFILVSQVCSRWHFKPRVRRLWFGAGLQIYKDIL